MQEFADWSLQTVSWPEVQKTQQQRSAEHALGRTRKHEVKKEMFLLPFWDISHHILQTTK